ncbi:MAG: DUF1343 domain-containing protein [Bacteroidota bacterium]
MIHDTVKLSQLKDKEDDGAEALAKKPITGADQPEVYIPMLADRSIGIVANQTSRLYDHPSLSKLPETINGLHLVDYLLHHKLDIKNVFAPEHGFRGAADAGELVEDGVDTRTGLPIISLHGKNKKPTPEQLAGIEVMVFDIQDVGVRFYTYISTLHLVMEACAEAGINLLVMDRPNPNGHYIDGPVMEKEHTSFLGMHTVPLVHGMTIGEYAQMINGEGWLKDGLKCNLEIVKIKNYSHDMEYSLRERPSPNLPNDVAINLYPSLGLLEGTTVNAGRGTESQFQLIGSPHLDPKRYSYKYTPRPNFGAKYPKYLGVECNGMDLRNVPRLNRLDLSWIMDAYQHHDKNEVFFNTKNFTAHAGTEQLQKQIEQGMTMGEIRETWLKDLQAYDQMRKKYLLYD